MADGLASLSGVLSTNITIEASDYTGPYEVTPKASVDQTLPTAAKTLLNNVRVKKIPTQEVLNPGGGLTFIIAEE